MKRKWNLAALLPGFLSLNSNAGLPAQDSEFDESIEHLKGIVITPLNTETPLYIAGHRSHQSHSSHGSHRSSSGGGSRSYPSSPSPTPAPSRSPSYNSDPLGQPSTPSYTAPKSSTGQTKKQFDRETLIMRVQISLRILGYYNGKPDGIMGPATRAALRQYRKDKGLPAADGIDSIVLNSLGIPAP